MDTHGDDECCDPREFNLSADSYGQHIMIPLTVSKPVGSDYKPLAFAERYVVPTPHPFNKCISFPSKIYHLLPCEYPHIIS